MSKHNVYRDGKVHVLKEMCATCIFRPGNLMQLKSGRVRGMVDGARRDESTIVCHSTLYRRGVEHAACRGFYDRYPTRPLQLAAAMGLIEEVDPPPKEENVTPSHPVFSASPRHAADLVTAVLPYAVADENGRVLVERRSNGQSVFMTYKTERGALAGRSRAASAFPRAQVVNGS